MEQTLLVLNAWLLGDRSHRVALDGLLNESGQLVAILTAAVKTARANDQRELG